MTPLQIDAHGNVLVERPGYEPKWITPEQAKYSLSITHPSGEREWLWVPTPKQVELHAAPEANVLFEGSRGTGKSVCVRWDFHRRALQWPGFKYVVLRRTFPELSKTHLASIEWEMKKLGGSYHRSNKTALYQNGSIGWFSHCETEQDVLNLLGGEFGGLFVDEASTFPWEWIVKLASSVRVPVGSGYTPVVRLGTNPLGQSVEDIWRRFVEKDPDLLEEDPEYDPKDYGHIHSVLADNEYLDANEYKKRFSGLPEHVRRAWLDGERMIEDQLFDVRRTKDNKPYHEIKELPTIDGQPLLSLPWVRFYRSYDGGFWPDPAYCLWLAVVGRRVIAFKEKVWFRKTAEEIARDIVEETRALGITVTTTFCDPSLDLQTGADIYTVRDKMEMQGVPMETSVNNREMFAAAIHSLLREEALAGVPRLQMLQAGAGVGAGLGVPYLLKTLPQQKYDPKKPMAMAPHKADHASVCLAYYALSSAAELNTAPITQHRVPKWLKWPSKPRVLGRDQVRGR